jgi:transposase-like protein
MITLHQLSDNAKCFETIRALRWPNKVSCPHCGSEAIIKQGKDDPPSERQRYSCKACQRKFDDLTGTLFAGHHQPLKIWVLCLFFMGLNLSNVQIARELDLNEADVQQMTRQLRSGMVSKRPAVVLEGEVECDEVYVVAGHKGQPEAVKKGRKGRRKPVKRRSWTRHAGQGKAADIGHDSTRRTSGHSDAGECSASDHPARYSKHDSARHAHLQR